MWSNFRNQSLTTRLHSISVVDFQDSSLQMTGLAGKIKLYCNTYRVRSFLSKYIQEWKLSEKRCFKIEKTHYLISKLEYRKQLLNHTNARKTPLISTNLGVYWQTYYTAKVQYLDLYSYMWLHLLNQYHIISNYRHFPFRILCMLCFSVLLCSSNYTGGGSGMKNFAE